MWEIAVKIRDAGSFPKALVESPLHIFWNERRPAKGAGLLVVADPPVHAPFVEDVTAVGQTPHLVLALELVQADGARLGRVDQVRELHHGEDFADQQGGDGLEFGDPGRVRRVRPGIVGFDEVLEAQ